jgi:CheY-like chemotaxis protein
MKKKLHNILLIDDSKADNFINSRIIKKADVTHNIVVTYGAREALNYLSTNVDGVFPNPEIIFLDINMPDMTGWDFLEEYRKLNDNQKAGVVVCMLTTSYADDDKQKALSYNILSDFSNKPLSIDKLMGIIENNFPELV